MPKPLIPLRVTPSSNPSIVTVTERCVRVHRIDVGMHKKVCRRANDLQFTCLQVGSGQPTKQGFRKVFARFEQGISKVYAR